VLRQLSVRLRALLRREAMEAELDEELRYHVESEIARNIARGLTPDAARFAALRAFGNSSQHKEAVRDAWGWRWLEQIGQDVRYALRGVRRAPIFALTVVLTIALGLGLNGTAFTIFDAYVLRPLSVRDPSSLYEITWVNRAGRRHAFSWPQYQELRRDPDGGAFSELLAYRFISARIDSTPSFGQLVTGNFFSMLGVGAALGRTLLPSDAESPGTAPVVVLSHRAWENRYGADSQIVGKSVRVRGYPLLVVGVARAGFDGLGDVPLDFWIPLTAIDQVEDGPSLFGPKSPEMLWIVGRLRPSVTVEQAKSELMTRARVLSVGRPDAEEPLSPRLSSQATRVPLDDELLVILAPILSAFGLVLLIACANVANMMLARGMARQREIGIRLSLGAARARLVRQLLTESVILALPAAAIGYGVSRATIGLGLRLMFATMPAEFAAYIRVVPLLPDMRVLTFMLATALVAAVFFGLAPALQATRPDVVQATRGDFDTGLRPSRLRNMLVVGQITVCVVLLVSAGVLLRGARRLERVDVGVRTRDVLQIDIVEKFRPSVVARLRATPGVV